MMIHHVTCTLFTHWLAPSAFSTFSYTTFGSAEMNDEKSVRRRPVHRARRHAGDRRRRPQLLELHHQRAGDQQEDGDHLSEREGARRQRIARRQTELRATELRGAELRGGGGAHLLARELLADHEVHHAGGEERLRLREHLVRHRRERRERGEVEQVVEGVAQRDPRVAERRRQRHPEGGDHLVEAAADRGDRRDDERELEDLRHHRHRNMPSTRPAPACTASGCRSAVVHRGAAAAAASGCGSPTASAASARRRPPTPPPRRARRRRARRRARGGRHAVGRRCRMRHGAVAGPATGAASAAPHAATNDESDATMIRRAIWSVHSVSRRSCTR